MRDQDLDELRTRLMRLLNMLEDAGQKERSDVEHTRIRAATNLPSITIQRIDAYQSGNRRIPKENLLQSTISNCTRGFPEIGADITETPGHVADQILNVLNFSLERRKAMPS
jgi:hypothetical protein